MIQSKRQRYCDIPGCRRPVSMDSARAQRGHHPHLTIYFCSRCLDIWYQSQIYYRFCSKIKNTGYVLYMKKRKEPTFPVLLERIQEQLPDIYRNMTQGIVKLETPKHWLLMLSPIIFLREFQWIYLTRIQSVIHLLKYRYDIWDYRYSPKKLRDIYQRIDADINRCQWEGCSNRHNSTRLQVYHPMLCPGHRALCQKLYSSIKQKGIDRTELLDRQMKFSQETLEDIDTDLLKIIPPSAYNPANWFYRATLISIGNAWKSGDLKARNHKEMNSSKSIMCCWPGCLHIFPKTSNQSSPMCDKHRIFNLSIRNMTSLQFDQHCHLGAIPGVYEGLRRGEKTVGLGIKDQWRQWIYVVSEVTAVPETQPWVVAWALRLMIEWWCDKEVVETVMRVANLGDLQWDTPIYDEFPSSQYTTHKFMQLKPPTTMSNEERAWWDTRIQFSRLTNALDSALTEGEKNDRHDA